MNLIKILKNILRPIKQWRFECTLSEYHNQWIIPRHFPQETCPKMCWYRFKNRLYSFKERKNGNERHTKNGNQRYRGDRTWTFQTVRWLLPNLTVLTVINNLAEMELSREHFSQFFPFCWCFNCFVCHIVSLIIQILNYWFFTFPPSKSFFNFRTIWRPKNAVLSS